VVALPSGGHCGFFDSLRGPGWVDRFIGRELADKPSSGPGQ
jgi:hypothetical protein